MYASIYMNTYIFLSISPKQLLLVLVLLLIGRRILYNINHETAS